MKTYIVSQTFETLGDPCRRTFTRKRDAERARKVLVREISEMVAQMETPDERTRPIGFAHESEAWKSAEETAGVKYDDDDKRTDESPKTYGIEAGRKIAEAAVIIEARIEL